MTWRLASTDDGTHSASSINHGDWKLGWHVLSPDTNACSHMSDIGESGGDWVFVVMQEWLTGMVGGNDGVCIVCVMEV